MGLKSVCVSKNTAERRLRMQVLGQNWSPSHSLNGKHFDQSHQQVDQSMRHKISEADELWFTDDHRQYCFEKKQICSKTPVSQQDSSVFSVTANVFTSLWCPRKRNAVSHDSARARGCVLIGGKSRTGRNTSPQFVRLCVGQIGFRLRSGRPLA